MNEKPRVILIEFAECEEMRSLAARLANEGHSICLFWRGETSEDPLDRLQLQLEQTGGISCAIKAETIEIALGKVQDLFGRVDEIVAFSDQFADQVSRVLQTIPAKRRPQFKGRSGL